MDVTIPCPCPLKADGAPRHESDTVTLPDVLDFRRMLTVRQTLRIGINNEPLELAEMTALLVEAYVVHCIDSWTLQDEKGKPVPVTKANVRELLLSNWEAAEKVGDVADDLYTEKVILPLVTRTSTSSSSTPTPASTSATTGTTTTRRRPSKRSSTTTSLMAVTGPMAASPGSGSNSWQS